MQLPPVWQQLLMLILLRQSKRLRRKIRRKANEQKRRTRSIKMALRRLHNRQSHNNGPLLSRTITKKVCNSVSTEKKFLLHSLLKNCLRSIFGLPVVLLNSIFLSNSHLTLNVAFFFLFTKTLNSGKKWQIIEPMDEPMKQKKVEILLDL